MSNLPFAFGTICGGFFFILVFALGLGLVLYSNKSKKKAGESQNWPAAPGTITVSEIRESRSTDDDGNVSVYYYPHVEYSYNVGGQPQTGKQVAFGGTQGYATPNQAEMTVKIYPVNSSVTVYYNPQKPQEACLVRSVGKGAKTARVMGIILLVISLLIFIPLLIGLIRN